MKVYVADTGAAEESLVSGEYTEFLSTYRLKKLLALKSEDDRLRSLAASLLLDYALQRYGLSENCSDYTLSGGKPSFSGVAPFEFSLSHSGKKVALAEDTHPVGIDIEQIRAIRPTVLNSLPESDIAYVLSADGEEQSIRFYTVWTMRESLLKLTGEGLSGGIASFELNNRNSTPSTVRNGKVCFFKTYRLGSYILSVCSQKTDFPTEAIKIERFTPFSHGGK